MSSLIINTLQGCGAEVSGVDLRQVTENEFDKIRQAFSEHGLLFFLGQELSELDHIQFAEKWGKININRFFTAHENHPQIAMVTKEPVVGTQIIPMTLSPRWAQFWLPENCLPLVVIRGFVTCIKHMTGCQRDSKKHCLDCERSIQQDTCLVL